MLSFKFKALDEALGLKQNTDPVDEKQRFWGKDFTGQVVAQEWLFLSVRSVLVETK